MGTRFIEKPPSDYNDRVIIGTAGHIDHGKTTLLKALTGIDTDRLQEEKRRGISIDIGFAHMQLGAYRLGFIDVPGHEKFIKNMLAGIGGIQLVLLVVAADESVMPQTVEHFHICSMLEIRRGIVVLTKKTLVDRELLPVVEMEIRELLRGSRLENAPILPVDSVSGDGIDDLRAVLLREIEQIASACPFSDPPSRVFRLPVDRVFTIRGFGTVVTGTPMSGMMKQGQEVSIHPLGQKAKVRGVEVFNQKADLARAGQRTALNLTGVQTEELQRGMVVCDLDIFTPTYMVDAIVQLLPDAPQILKQRAAIRFHHGSAELIGRLHLLEGRELRPGKSTIAQLRLNRPTVCCPKDRFVLRRYSPMTTIGGGVILDGRPSKHRKKDLKQVLPELKKLQSLWKDKATSLDGALVEYFVWLRGIPGMTVPELVSRTGILEPDLLELLQSAPSIALIPQAPLLAVNEHSLRRLKTRIVEFLTEFHRRHPLEVGVSREELRERFLRRASGSYFQHLLETLKAEEKIELNASTVSLHGQQVELSSEQRKLRGLLLEKFQTQTLQVPTLQELMQELPNDPQQIRTLFFFLLKKGELVRITDEIVLSPPQVTFLRHRLKQAFPPGKTFTVTDFKELFKLTRKHAIPLLEFLDRERVTRRLEDKRVVL